MFLIACETRDGDCVKILLLASKQEQTRECWFDLEAPAAEVVEIVFFGLVMFS